MIYMKNITHYKFIYRKNLLNLYLFKINIKMDKYFGNSILLQNTLLPYFCDGTFLKPVNKLLNRLDYEKYNTHLQPHGLFETYYKNTKLIKEQKIYVNGKLSGLFEEWYQNGILKYRINYKNGERNGLSEEWYDDGKLMYKINFKDGNRDGLCEQWYDNGRLWLRKNYKSGVLNGLYEGWNQKGELWLRCNYEDEKLNGLLE